MGIEIYKDQKHAVLVLTSVKIWECWAFNEVAIKLIMS